MNENVMGEIIDLCLEIDRRANSIYSGFAENHKEAGIAGYWTELADEERGHIEYWEKLRTMASDGLIPVIFDDPQDVKHELSEILGKIDGMMPESFGDADMARRLLIAYRLEFYMLHRAFGTLFNFIKTVSGEKTPSDDYEGHIEHLMNLLDKYSSEAPELELVGETLHKLWRENKYLIHQNTYDFLTGVFSRRGMFNTMVPMAHLAKRNSETIGIIMIDIDDFKSVNDTHGHQKGDEVLKVVAGGITGGIRRSDIVGRYGGEEFLVFLPSVTPGATELVANKIRKNVGDRSSAIVPVTISAGFAEKTLTDDVEEDLKNYIKTADDNMYRAKKSGKNCVVG